MKIGLPIELLSFEWIRRLRDDISQVLPDAQFFHVAGQGGSGQQIIPLSEGDACFPFKKMIRTAMALLPEVDKLLIPRLVRLDGHLLCPNFRAFPDLVALNRDRLAGPEKKTPIVDTVVEISSRDDEEKVRVKLLQTLLSKNEISLKMDFPLAERAEDKASTLRTKLAPYAKNIALIGRAYMVQDPHLNMGIAEILNGQGYGVITPQDVDFQSLDQVAARNDYYAKTMYWRGARECLGAFMHFTEEFAPAGIIYLLSFNCGVDALVRIELMSLHKKLEKKIPMMVLVGDEHSQREHVVTRLEAFLDVIDGITTS
ncbi:MAG: acyl-CoA dehydratase activase-related protein [Thermodesulfobacteriota bacterium]